MPGRRLSRHTCGGRAGSFIRPPFSRSDGADVVMLSTDFSAVAAFGVSFPGRLRRTSGYPARFQVPGSLNDLGKIHAAGHGVRIL
jgi:hypothetical protein